MRKLPLPLLTFIFFTHFVSIQAMEIDYFQTLPDEITKKIFEYHVDDYRYYSQQAIDKAFILYQSDSNASGFDISGMKKLFPRTPQLFLIDTRWSSLFNALYKKESVIPSFLISKENKHLKMAVRLLHYQSERNIINNLKKIITIPPSIYVSQKDIGIFINERPLKPNKSSEGHRSLQLADQRALGKTPKIYQKKLTIQLNTLTFLPLQHYN